MRIDAQGKNHRQLNQEILQAAQAGEPEVTLDNVLGHRYIGTNLRQPLHLTINGIPGNDLAAFADGPEIIVRGNAQDCVCNTMNHGRVVVHGSAGDVLGYSMRGGELYVAGDVGYRVGIHMKSYVDMSPTIIIGGRARDFLGEYLAGGTLIVIGLGCPADVSPVGSWVGTGMHGGAIYVRGKLEAWQLGQEVSAHALDETDAAQLASHLADFAESLGTDLDGCEVGQFVKLSPHSARPYGKLYAP
jgi:glutamate synthase domain-containing protein 3